MAEETKLWNSKFILIFITNLLMYGVFYALNPVIPIYGMQIGFSPSQIGLVLTSMSITTILFRPLAGYLLDNFNRYSVFLIFLALLCISFLGYPLFTLVGALVCVRLFTGAVWSICGSSTVTLAGDTLPRPKIGMGISRFTLTIALGMAVGPFIGIQIQNSFGSHASFYVLFGMAVIAFICAFSLRLKYPETERKPFRMSTVFYKPAAPFMLNMAFIMIPYGAFLAFTTTFAIGKGLMSSVALFYVFMSCGLLASKLGTQKIVDSGSYKGVVLISLLILAAAMYLFQYVSTPIHLFIIALVLGVGYGILQPLFQSMVTSIAPPPKRGAANSTYLLSYDIGIGLGAFAMGQVQATIGLGAGFAYTAIGYAVAVIIFFTYTQGYYRRKLAEAPPPGPPAVKPS